MSRRVGGADEEGFFFQVTYNTKSTWDMDEMSELLGDEDTNTTVTHYDSDHVVVLIRPDRGWF